VVPEAAYPLMGDNAAVMVDAHPGDGRGGFNAQPSRELLDYLAWADALVVGPGLSDSPGAVSLTERLLAERDLPVLVDADGLRALPVETAGRDWPLVLTPHVGELARLAGLSPAQVLDRWFDVCTETAARLDAFLLAKCNQCMLTTPEGAMLFPQHGHPALATGGTGDVLSGILGALLARQHVLAQQPGDGGPVNAVQHRLKLAEIITTAVNIHAHASRLGVERLGAESLSPVDLVQQIPAALAEMSRQC